MKIKIESDGPDNQIASTRFAEIDTLRKTQPKPVAELLSKYSRSVKKLNDLTPDPVLGAKVIAGSPKVIRRATDGALVVRLPSGEMCQFFQQTGVPKYLNPRMPAGPLFTATAHPTKQTSAEISLSVDNKGKVQASIAGKPVSRIETLVLTDLDYEKTSSYKLTDAQGNVYMVSQFASGGTEALTAAQDAAQINVIK